MLDINSDYSIFSKKFLWNWKFLLRFELISFIGRHIFQKRPPKLFKENFLNLGCGDFIYDEWINADFFKVRFWKVPKNGWSLDFRYPFKCNDNYWEGIFTEHTIEHLHPQDDLNLFKELFRTLKPGCWLRISVPGLEQHLIEYYENNISINGIRELHGTKAEAIWSLTQNWGHLSVWSAELLTIFLEKAGFVNIKEVNFGEGEDKRIIKESEIRRRESLYIEAQKPLK